MVCVHARGWRAAPYLLPPVSRQGGTARLLACEARDAHIQVRARGVAVTAKHCRAGRSSDARACGAQDFVVGYTGHVPRVRETFAGLPSPLSVAAKAGCIFLGGGGNRGSFPGMITGSPLITAGQAHRKKKPVTGGNRELAPLR